MIADDMDLLRQYAQHNSEDAFASLVSRHINLVYSVALRCVRDPHLAEEITQAVFIILARKAGSLNPKTIVTGWLCRTARNVSARALTMQQRRQNREQEAYMQSLLNEPESTAWADISPLLDTALGHLGEKDHDAIVLRFLGSRSFKDVAAALGTSEDAAKVRVHRALDKLQKFFTKKGIVLSAAVIAGAVSANSVRAAPVALTQTVTTIALGKSAVASVSTLALAKAILFAMKTKTILTAAALTVLILGLGTGAYIIHHSRAARAAAHPPSDKVPLELPNDTFMDPANSLAAPFMGNSHASADKFLNELDTNTLRTAGSQPSSHIKCLVEPTSKGPADYLASLPDIFSQGLAASRMVLYAVDEDSSLFGKRIQVRGWMKTKDVRNWAGASLAVVNLAGHIFASDNMFDRPLDGTTDWQPVEFVTDIPKEPCLIYLSPTLYGTGEIWTDDFQIDVVPSKTPLTDDRRWTVWSQDPTDYSETIDPNVTHGGHPSRCIAYTSSEAPHKYAFIWWGIHNRDHDSFRKYLGHTVRMSAWTKSANISGRAGLDLEPKGPNGRELAKQSAYNQIKSTSDWARQSVTCFVPKDTEDFQTAFYMHGSGTLWIDQESFKCEIIK